MSNRGKIRINKSKIGNIKTGYWWSIVGLFGPGVVGWRLTKNGAINAARKAKAKYEERSRQYENPDWLIEE